ncbi:hypothetical protein [Paenibacillus jiagnxiensis]|uniref:hypothetical protein n=1 Tax=Paenibacillus jiagnxiensis TaxID=3228926 RepID=UPI0033B9F2E2
MKFLKVFTVFALFISFLGIESRVYGEEQQEELYIPEGFETAKIFDSSEGPIEDSSVQIYAVQNSLQGIANSQVGTDEGISDVQIVKNETRPLQELRSLTTEEVITQYKTDIEIQAIRKWDENSGDNKGNIRGYISIYWDKYKGKPSDPTELYVGIDKIDYRFTNKNWGNWYVSADLDYFQVGPTANGANGSKQYKLNKKSIIKDGSLVTELVRNNGWSPVLETSGASSVGARIDADVYPLVSGGRVDFFTVGLMIVGDPYIP